MNRSLLHTLTRMLDERERVLRELIAQRQGEPDSGPPQSEPLGDQADQAQTRERKALDHDLLDLDLAELAQIESARERIAAGTYGKCIDCGEPIGARRLRAQPTARRCVDCQARRERFSAVALR